MNRKAHRISALDIFLLVLLTLGFALFTSAQITAVPELDRATASGLPDPELFYTDHGEGNGALSFLVLSGTNRSETGLQLPTALLWGTRNTGSDTMVALPLRCVQAPSLWEGKASSVPTEKELTAHMAACGGASFANLGHQLLGSNPAYTKSLSTDTSTLRGNAGDWQARTSGHGSSSRQFTGEPRPRNPLLFPVR